MSSSDTPSSKLRHVTVHVKTPTVKEVNDWYLDRRVGARDTDEILSLPATANQKLKEYCEELDQQQRNRGPLVFGRQLPSRYRDLESNRIEADQAVSAAAQSLGDTDNNEAFRAKCLAECKDVHASQARIFVWGKSTGNIISRFEPSIRAEFDKLGAQLSIFPLNHAAEMYRAELLSTLKKLDTLYPLEYQNLWQSDNKVFERTLSLTRSVIPAYSDYETMEKSLAKTRISLETVVTSDFPGYNPSHWKRLEELPSDICNELDKHVKRVSWKLHKQTDERCGVGSIGAIKLTRRRHWAQEAQERANNPFADPADPSSSKGKSVLSKFSSRLKSGLSLKDTNTKDSEREILFVPRVIDPTSSSGTETHSSESGTHSEDSGR